MTDYSDSFETTWKIYPKRNGKKVGKYKAFSEWQKLDLEDQRKAYSDIKSRNLAGGWEYVKDMERYLKYRGWEDEWTGQRVTSNPDLVDKINSVTVEQLCEFTMQHRPLCNHQIRATWTYYGPEPGIFTKVVIPECKPCDKPMQRVQSSEIPI